MNENNKTFYVTTPIYYPSGKLQLGNTYTTVLADSLTRFHKNLGEETFFLTGTDEHGLKIQQKAKAENKSEKQYLDEMAENIKELWKVMDIQYDKFIRTTAADHELAVQKIFKKLLNQGDIYKGEYEGWYSVSDEEYFTESQLSEVYRDEKGKMIGGKAPSGHEVELVKEEAYFFKMSKYADWLLNYYRQHPEFLQPESRMNEMIKNFIEPGLEDLAVTRTSFDWGVKVPGDEHHVIYVWIDALSNYITALGFDPENAGQQADLFKKFWPANLQLVGKEIVRFHTIYWPIMLHALGVELPKEVLGHGWLVMKNGKMSKSKGNVIYPEVLVDRYGLDAVRYYLLRTMPFGNDGVFTPEDFVARINYDLANDLGNLLNRTVSMINQYFSGEIKSDGQLLASDTLKELANQTIATYIDSMNSASTSDALESVWKLVKRTNKYIDETQPWILNKENQVNELMNVMANLTESLRVIAILIYSVMPGSSLQILHQLGLDNNQTLIGLTFDLQNKEHKVVEKPEPLWPRLKENEEIQFIASLVNKDNRGKGRAAKEEKKIEVKENTIEFSDFEKVKMVAAKIQKGEIVQDSKKLLKFQLDDGSGTLRQILSGIRQWYPNPEELIGKTVIIVTNLSPRKMAGEISQGMILAAEDKEGNVTISELPNNVVPGSIIG